MFYILNLQLFLWIYGMLNKMKWNEMKWKPFKQFVGILLDWVTCRFSEKLCFPLQRFWDHFVEWIFFIHVTDSKPTNYLLATWNVWWLSQQLKRKHLEKSWYLIRREDENYMICNLDSSHWPQLQPCIMLNVNQSCQHCANLIVSYTTIISKSQSLDLVQYFWVTENIFTLVQQSWPVWDMCMPQAS